MSDRVRQPEVQRSTFYLLWCERCGHAAEPPTQARMPDFVAPAQEAMACNECGEFLHLIECFTAPQTTMWQARPGATWHHVIYAESLPRERGRQVWMRR